MKLKILIGLALLGLTSSAFAGPIAAVYMMYSAVAAAGSVAAVMGTFATGAMFIGGAVSLVGYASGDKDLIKIGSVLGVAGGAANLLTSAAGAAGATGGTAGGAAGGAAAEAGATSITPLAGSEAATGGEAALAGSAGGSTAGAAGETVTQMPGPQAIEAAANSGGSVSGADITPTPTPTATPPSDGGVTTTPVPSATTTTTPAAAVSNVEQPGLIDRGLTWMKDNPEATKLGSGIIQGAMKAYGEQEARSSEMDYYDRLRRQYSDSVIGMNKVPQFIKPGATVTRGPVQNPGGYWIPGSPPPVVPPTRG